METLSFCDLRAFSQKWSLYVEKVGCAVRKQIFPLKPTPLWYRTCSPSLSSSWRFVLQESVQACLHNTSRFPLMFVCACMCARKISRFIFTVKTWWSWLEAYGKPTTLRAHCTCRNDCKQQHENRSNHLGHWWSKIQPDLDKIPLLLPGGHKKITLIQKMAGSPSLSEIHFNCAETI